MDMRKLIGRNVKRIRLEKGLTQEQFAELSGFTQQYLSGLERGRRNPTIVSLYEIALALAVEHVALVTPDDEALTEEARRLNPEASATNSSRSKEQEPKSIKRGAPARQAGAKKDMKSAKPNPKIWLRRIILPPIGAPRTADRARGERKKPRPISRAGRWRRSVQSPLALRPRDQMRV